MRHFMIAGALGSALALTAVASAQPAPPSAAHPRIDGAWTLNRQMGDQARGGQDGGSDRAGYGGRGRRGGFGVGGGGMGGGMRGGGMPGMGGMGGAMPDREEMARRRALMRELVEPSPRLTIATDGDLVSFTDADGHVRKYTANGKKEKHQFDNGTVKTKTKWDQDRLVIETSLDDGAKLTQAYALAADRRQLVVETRMEGGRMGGDGDRPPITHYYDDVAETQ